MIAIKPPAWLRRYLARIELRANCEHDFCFTGDRKIVCYKCGLRV